ncbi:MAG TPA: type IV toxin-antitoxin system AbiEi family antitoxin domain-containing protein [Gemmatimonadota bacterium]|nr:type IV toxin-antitoxin system AbiEi family antitoxin domain-containing protein [Gemmatimonadota bacterium]
MPTFRDHYLGAPDFRALRRVAAAQDGLFTIDEGRACGFSRGLLSYHVRSGRLHRARRGIYRWPGPDEVPLEWGGITPGPYGRVRLEWMSAGRAHAAVSHSTALWLLGLMDEPVGAVHLTLHRRRRGTVPSRDVQRARRVRIHLLPVRPPEGDRVERHGMVVVVAEQSIVDAAKEWTSPYAVEEAIARGLVAGSVSAAGLLARARRRGERVRKVVEAALAGARRDPTGWRPPRP